MNPDLLISVEGHVGRLRLNRPKALHALTLEMCEAMLETLVAWRSDPAVHLVIVDHAEGRGFCAGGDVRAVAESGKGDGAYARRFFFAEYRLNHLMFTYAKPIVAFMDGITMGGGVGISQPAKYRIVTERTVFAMPETSIGLFPDVGGGWYLSRLAGRMGEYLGLTGARADGAESLALGIGTHHIPSDAVEGVKAALIAEPQAVEAILAAAQVAPTEAKLLAHRADIDRLFASDSYEDILATLAADGSEWAARHHALLLTKSPQACKVTLRLIAQGRSQMDFAAEMMVEYRVVVRVCQRPDFVEGVRALLIDKSNDPLWSPATPEGVTDHMLDRIFAPFDTADEEWSPQPLS